LSKPKTILSVCNKIALQINCKLGGELWRLDIPLSKTMLVGIDVCHDTSGARGGGGRQSVAGFCASMNGNFTKYYSRVSFQRTGQELVDGLKLCMTEALRAFFELNRYLPDIIVVYRDGVGDGMLEAVVCCCCRCRCHCRCCLHYL
jgi:aubergine-like protein